MKKGSMHSASLSRRLAVSLAIIALCTGTSTGQNNAASHDVDGAEAPANCWYTAGGCAARTGATRTRPLTKAATPAWTFTTELGAIVGEPLVWRDVIVVCEVGAEERRIHFLDLQDGSAYCRPLVFVGGARAPSLSPSMWGDRLAVRTSAFTIDVYRISCPVAERIQSYRFENDVSAPLLFRDELYACDGRLSKRRIGAKATEWVKGKNMLGAPSLRGANVWAAQKGRKARGGGFQMQVKAFDRTSGRIEENVVATFSNPQGAATPRLMIGDNSLVATLGVEALHRRSTTGGFAVSLPQTQRGTAFLLGNEPCAIDKGWIAFDKRGSFTRGASWIRTHFDGRPGIRGVTLANDKHHSGLMKVRSAASAAAGVVYLGNLAFDTGRGLVLWRHSLKVGARSIPVRNGLLVGDGQNKLTLLRGKAPSTGWQRILASSPQTMRNAKAGKHKSSILVTNAGARRKTTVTFDAALGMFSVGGGSLKKTFKSADVALLIGKQRQLLFWGGTPQQVAGGLTALIEHQVDRAFIKLALSSTKTNDVPVIKRYLAEMRVRGARKSQIKKLEKNLRRIARLNHRIRPKQVAQLRTKEKSLYRDTLSSNESVFDALVKELPFAHALRVAVVMLQRDPSVFDKVTTALDRFDKDLDLPQRLARSGALLASVPAKADALWRELSPHLAKASTKIRVRVARWFLEVDPEHAGASEMVRKMSPIKVAGAEKVSALEWLDLLESTAGIEFKVIRMPKDVSNFTPSPELRELAKQTERWRKDLVAIQSDRIVIYTPLANPGRIARCLSMGELVCDTMEAMFAYSMKKRSKALRLKIMLYGTKREYVRQSMARGTGHVGWTAGHYDPNDRVARMFLPAGRAAFDSVMHVFAHELAHYWVDVQCPLVPFQAQRRPVRAPGFWIVEGFASMIEGFEYDLGKRTMKTVKQNCSNLDLLASATEKQILPWPIIFKLSQLGMHTRLAKRPRPSGIVNSNWRLGTSAMLGQVNMFYMQSASACHYLYNVAGGKYRERLLDFLGDYYTGKVDRLDIEKVFGMTPEVLGARITAYAKRVTRAN